MQLPLAARAARLPPRVSGSTSPADRHLAPTLPTFPAELTCLLRLPAAPHRQLFDVRAEQKWRRTSAWAAPPFACCAARLPTHPPVPFSALLPLQLFDVWVEPEVVVHVSLGGGAGGPDSVVFESGECRCAVT